MVRGASGRLHGLSFALLAAALVLIGCQGGATPSGGNGSEPPPEEDRVASHDWYVRNPTDLEAARVRLVLPADYGDDIAFTGLSNGWTEDGDNLVLSGVGGCSMRLYSLTVRAQELTVTLVPAGDEPEVVIQAVGHATLAHSVKDVGNWVEDAKLIQIRNEKIRYTP